MLLGELRRWGLAREAVDQLLPHADRAIEWIEHFGDRDGDGYVEYQRTSDRGLVNQGWKDSFDGIRFADGRLPQAPIALCEVQGIRVRAPTWPGPTSPASRATTAPLGRAPRAGRPQLKANFNRDFWLEDRGWLAHGPRPGQAAHRRPGLQHGPLPVDRHRRRRQGRCSWPSGCCRRELFSGWGVRTLGTSMIGYNPISYHCGSVWPHDNAIVAAGLMRYGFVEEAQRVIMAMLDAAVAAGGPASRAVQRAGSPRAAHGGRLPDVVLTAGVGGGVAAADAAHPAALRSLGAAAGRSGCTRPCRSGSAVSGSTASRSLGGGCRSTSKGTGCR